MTTMRISARGLGDGTQFVHIACACGFDAVHRTLAGVVLAQAAHKSAGCDWTAPPAPNGAVSVGASSAVVPLTRAAIATVLGISVGIIPLSPADVAQTQVTA